MSIPGSTSFFAQTAARIGAVILATGLAWRRGIRRSARRHPCARGGADTLSPAREQGIDPRRPDVPHRRRAVLSDRALLCRRGDRGPVGGIAARLATGGIQYRLLSWRTCRPGASSTGSRPPGSTFSTARLVRSTLISPSFEALVTALRGHPALLFWELEDEPLGNGVSFEESRRGRELLKQLDPDHPILGVQWPDPKQAEALCAGRRSATPTPSTTTRSLSATGSVSRSTRSRAFRAPSRSWGP